MNLVGKNVKAYLHTGATVEGVIKEHNQEMLILKSPNSKNILIVYQPYENILMLQVLEEAIKVIPQEIAQPESPELDHYEPDPTLRVQKLAELRQLQVKEHKANLGRHITSWQGGPTNLNPVSNYEYPNFTQPSTIDRSSKKNR